MSDENHFSKTRLHLLLLTFAFLIQNCAFGQLEPDSLWKKEVSGYGNGNYSISYFKELDSNKRQYMGRDVLNADSILIERNRINHSNNTTIGQLYIDGILRINSTCIRGEYCLIISYDSEGRAKHIEQIDSDNLKDGWQFEYDENGLVENAELFEHGKKLNSSRQIGSN